MTNREKRMAIFEVGASAIARYRNGDNSLYFCPICANGYTRQSAENGDALTLEHVPPKSINGKDIIMTCRKCNSRSGDVIDAHVANKQELDEFSKIASGSSLDGVINGVSLKTAESSITVEIFQEDDRVNIKAINKASNPKDIDNTLKTLNEMKQGNGGDLILQKQFKINERSLELSYLKSAFLLVTAWLGYGYAFNPILQLIRKQLMNPTETIVEDFFVPRLNSDNTSFQRKIFIVRIPYSSMLVTFDQHSVILPFLTSDENLYSNLKSMHSDTLRITASDKIIDWPSKIIMCLDRGLDCTGH